MYECVVDVHKTESNWIKTSDADADWSTKKEKNKRWKEMLLALAKLQRAMSSPTIFPDINQIQIHWVRDFTRFKHKYFLIKPNHPAIQLAIQIAHFWLSNELAENEK